MGKVIIHICLGSLLASLNSCATQIGRIEDTIQMPSNVEFIEPDFVLVPPQTFPPIALVWEQSRSSHTSGRYNAIPQHANRADIKTRADSRTSTTTVPKYLSSKAKRFVIAAEKIARAISQGYSTDPAIALSLLEQLKTDSDLAELRKEWEPSLNQSIDTIQIYLPITGPLRRLRKAFNNAKFDGDFGVYRDLDITTCRAETDNIKASLKQPKHPIYIAPIGTQTITHFRTLCEQSLLVELSEREFPTPLAPARLRALVKAKYEDQFQNAALRKLHVIWPWKAGNSTRSIRVIAGIQRKKSYPAPPCSIETLVIRQEKRRTKWVDTTLTETAQIRPIACEKLR